MLCAIYAEISYLLFLSKCRILSIITRALSVVKELSKIKSCYFAAEEKLASLSPTRKMVYVKIIS